MKYSGNSKAVAGMTMVGNVIIELAKIVVPAMGFLTFWYGPRVLPWYKG